MHLKFNIKRIKHFLSKNPEMFNFITLKLILVLLYNFSLSLSKLYYIFNRHLSSCKKLLFIEENIIIFHIIFILTINTEIKKIY